MKKIYGFPNQANLDHLTIFTLRRVS